MGGDILKRGCDHTRLAQWVGMSKKGPVAGCDSETDNTYGAASQVVSPASLPVSSVTPRGTAQLHYYLSRFPCNINVLLA